MTTNGIRVDDFKGVCASVFIRASDLDNFSRINSGNIAQAGRVLRASSMQQTVGLCLFSYYPQARQVTFNDIEVIEDYRRLGIGKLLLGEVFKFASLRSTLDRRTQILFTGFTSIGRTTTINNINYWMGEMPDVDVYSF